MAKRVLLVVLDGVLSSQYRQGLAGERFLVDSAHSEQHALGMLAMRCYQAMVISASSAALTRCFLETLNAQRLTRPPVVYCIGAMTTGDEISLLEAGATACREPGVAFVELLAHIRALLRRVNGYPRHHRVADLGIDPIGRRASRRGAPLPLRPIEFDLLLHLAEGEGRPVSKAELLRRLWPNGGGSDNLLAVHVRNLRRVVEKDRRRRLLHTVRNSGYALRETARNAS